MQRINLILKARALDDLFQIRALDLHPLTGDRRGQFAIRLTGRMRLIFTLDADRHVTIEEVVDYHD